MLLVHEARKAGTTMTARWRSVILAGTCAFLLVGAAADARESPRRRESRGPGSVWDSVYTVEQAKRGESVYVAHCTTCHGPEMLGDDDTPPLAGAGFMANWNAQSVGGVFDRIRKTMPQDNPSLLALPQIADVVAYILSYNKFPAGKVELVSEVDSLKLIRIEPAKNPPHSP